VTNDEPMKAIAHRWLEEGRSFPGLDTSGLRGFTSE
jgi:hypothetical protein